jgi:hypothetical protein
MARRRPHLDLSLPDPSRQIAEFCAEFPQLDYDDIMRVCRLVESRLALLRAEARTPRGEPRRG